MYSSKHRINEDYIHYLWKYGLFEQLGLKTTDGDEIEIIDRGDINFDSGPDFSGSQIRIAEQKWVGNVEIHFKSSDWNAHAHDSDPAYNNVILHVVIHHDKAIQNANGQVLPTLSLSPYLSIDHFKNYEKFISSRSWIPCANQVSTVDPFKWLALKERMAIDRLTKKSEVQLSNLEKLDGDWEDLCYSSIARSFGAKVNSDAFEELVSRVPLKLVSKHSDDQALVEALFLGQAGFLQENELFADDYSKERRKEYLFLQQKYGLSPMNKGNWKNSRIRPSSLPQIRIVQFSRVISSCDSLLSTVLRSAKSELFETFTLRLDGYWMSHVGLGRQSKAQGKSIGPSLINRILINTVVPIRFAYGLFVKETGYKDSALSLLESLEVEDNKIVRGWKALGVDASHALDSQALLQLKSTLCDDKKCLKCPIGQELLRK